MLPKSSLVSQEGVAFSLEALYLAALALYLSLFFSRQITLFLRKLANARSLLL